MLTSFEDQTHVHLQKKAVIIYRGRRMKAEPNLQQRIMAQLHLRNKLKHFGFFS